MLQEHIDCGNGFRCYYAALKKFKVERIKINV